MSGLRKCPTPGKTGFRDRLTAQVVMADIQRLNWRDNITPCRAYRCKCGEWHLTSRPESK